MICQGSEPLITSKTGDIISYIPPTGTNQNFIYKTLTCDYPGPHSKVLYTFTEGELVISLFVFGIFLILLFDLIYRQFVGNRIKRL